ncbi:unnamed protein product [marine sediment metagenome]|uniref:Uncharacterized protein n=1 Tax=marine sediment metagenome TaxID=412755 RepID=X1NIX4_9ZZZZ
MIYIPIKPLIFDEFYLKSKFKSALKKRVKNCLEDLMLLSFEIAVETWRFWKDSVYLNIIWACRYKILEWKYKSRVKC